MHQELVIVLVEDDDGHALLVERNLRRAGISNAILRARDGHEGLQRISSAVAEGQPLLVLLDISMPKIDGLQVLKTLKSTTATVSVPVVMLTTTDDPREVERCYQLGCNLYITKPVQYEAFIEAVSRLGLFLQVVHLPASSRG